MPVRISALALAALLSLATGVSAQSVEVEPPRATVGLSFLVGEPVDEFSDYVDAAFGGELLGRYPLDPRGLVSLRADLGIMVYGHESKRVCIGGTCRIQGRLNTSNNIFFGGLGPELGVPLGFARPYANAFLGFGYFNTSSSLEDLGGGEDLFNTENFGDGTFSWGLGGGVEIRLGGSRTPVALNLGARYHRHGVMEYLTEGDIVDLPDGSVELYPNRSEANLITYRLGITIGIPRGVGENQSLSWLR